jgi:hypothetical protein
MPNENALPDWITAVATVATAIAASLAGVAAWLTFRRQARSILPVIEQSFRWLRDDVGCHIVAHLVIRNVLYETLVVESTRVLRPRGSRISHTLKRPDVNDRATGLEVGTSDETALGWEVRPYGTPPMSLRPESFKGIPPDIRVDDLYVTPPANWRGGKVKLVLTISSKALTISGRTIVIRGTLGGPPSHDVEGSKPV